MDKSFNDIGFEEEEYNSEKEIDIVSGTIKAVLYSNDENGYTVFKMTTDTENTITAVGYLPYVHPGQWIYAEGQWNNHHIYGTQFSVEEYDLMMPKTKENLFIFLSNGAVKYVGASTAALLINKFGENVLDVIENEPEKLQLIKGISPSRALEISKSFRKQLQLHRLVDYIAVRGLRPLLAVRLYRYYGDQAMMQIQENPYLLCADRIGGTFHEADSFADSLGIEKDSMERIKAAILFELKHNLNNGHCFITVKKLCIAASTMLSLDEELCLKGIHSLADSDEVVIEPIGNVIGCYLKNIYEAEKYTAERIVEFCRNRLQVSMDTEILIHQVENRQGIQYSEEQKSVLKKAMENQIVVLTGGPGTGKTTSVCAILAAFDRLGYKTFLCAPTGRAAKRITELTGREASTLHRLLGAKMSDDKDQTIFCYNEDEPLDCDAVIVDECSMIDIMLMKSLLCAIPDNCRVILVGDVDQLPAVGPGKVFHDIINSEVVPTIRLNKIFRQKENSRIVRNAHKIIHGIIPEYKENKGDFFRLKRVDPKLCVDTVVSLCSHRIPENMGIAIEDIQILSPTKKEETGTVYLNQKLQEALNPPGPGKTEKVFGNIIFREGDRVMQTRNNYDIIWSDSKGIESGQGVYNGDIGIIQTIDLGNRLISVNFDGHIAKYEFESMDELDHAWALTVHKSQGSEYRAVILVLHSFAQALMNRGLLYTAITRAKELLIIVGRDEVFETMVATNREEKRYSGLRLRLIEADAV